MDASIRLLDRRASPAIPGLLGRVRELLREAPPGPFVDVGCGGGELLELAASDGRPGFGVDLAPRDAAGARADAAALPFRSGCLGLMTSLLVTHYLRRPALALAECRRVLRPGGLLLLADRVSPYQADERRRWDRIEKLRNPRLRRLLTPMELRAAAARAGFRPLGEELWTRLLPAEDWLTGLEAARARRVRDALWGADAVALRVRLLRLEAL
jgi:SAM-dependent methyltransferase